MNHVEEAPVERKKKNGNGKNGKVVGVSLEKPEVVVAPHVNKPPVDQDRYIEYLERKVAQLEWELKHSEMESITEREKSRIRKLEFFMRSIQNAPFDDNARALLDSLRKEALQGVSK